MKQSIQTEPLSAIFAISRGNKLDLNKMQTVEPTRDAIAFVGRSGVGNGIVAFVAAVKGITPYAAGNITVALGGSALSSFVQPQKFYTAQNVDVLIPREEMSIDEKLYYCLCIEANRFRYSTFGREANRTLKNLMVPSRDSLPKWVEGSTATAAADLNRQLIAALKV